MGLATPLCIVVQYSTVQYSTEVDACAQLCLFVPRKKHDDVKVVDCLRTRLVHLPPGMGATRLWLTRKGKRKLLLDSGVARHRQAHCHT